LLDQREVGADEICENAVAVDPDLFHSLSSLP
jgi:hypothetical protein